MIKPGSIIYIDDYDIHEMLIVVDIEEISDNDFIFYTHKSAKKEYLLNQFEWIAWSPFITVICE